MQWCSLVTFKVLKPWSVSATQGVTVAVNNPPLLPAPVVVNWSRLFEVMLWLPAVTSSRQRTEQSVPMDSYVLSPFPSAFRSTVICERCCVSSTVADNLTWWHISMQKRCTLYVMLVFYLHHSSVMSPQLMQDCLHCVALTAVCCFQETLFMSCKRLWLCPALLSSPWWGEKFHPQKFCSIEINENINKVTKIHSDVSNIRH